MTMLFYNPNGAHHLMTSLIQEGSLKGVFLKYRLYTARFPAEESYEEKVPPAVEEHHLPTESVSVYLTVDFQNSAANPNREFSILSIQLRSRSLV